MIKRSILAIVILIAPWLIVLAGCAKKQEPEAKKEVDPVQSFRLVVEGVQQKATSTMPVYYNHWKKGWAKRKIIISDVKYDVVKTDSLVSPFVGKLDLSVTLQQSSFFLSREQAEVATSFSFDPPGSLNTSECRVQYALQEGKWVIKNRECRDFEGAWNGISKNEPDSWPTVFLLMIE